MRECGTGRHHAESKVALEAHLRTRVTWGVEWGMMSAGVKVQGENHGDSVRSCVAGAAGANLCPCHAKYCLRCPFCGLHRHTVNLPSPPLIKILTPSLSSHHQVGQLLGSTMPALGHNWARSNGLQQAEVV